MQQLLQFQYYNKKICSMIGLQINTTAVHFTSCVEKKKRKRLIKPHLSRNNVSLILTKGHYSHFMQENLVH